MVQWKWSSLRLTTPWNRCHYTSDQSVTVCVFVCVKDRVRDRECVREERLGEGKLVTLH